MSDSDRYDLDRCSIVVIDDSSLQCKIWKHYLENRFNGQLQVICFTDPRRGVEEMHVDADMILVDWEMPDMDGMAVLEELDRRGIDLKQVIIVSSHPVDHLHEVFDPTGCLAVIEKTESAQQAAFMMILDDLVRRKIACATSDAAA